VAQLAGVSVEYYTQIERGNLRGVAESVLHALATALRPDPAEREHLVDLARSAGDGAPLRRRAAPPQTVRPGVQHILDSQLAPAWVSNGRGDVLAPNRLGRALNAPLSARP
jgi:transcriptional regulator with XRE-family HTH domain